MVVPMVATRSRSSGKPFAARVASPKRVISMLCIVILISIISRRNASINIDDSNVKEQRTASSVTISTRVKKPQPNMKVYTANEMPNIQSTGPSGINKIGGLMEFNNVCLTKHISGTELEGVIHFTSDPKALSDKERCKHHSSPLNHHYMLAANVTDYSACMAALQLKEYQHIPWQVEAVHYFEEPIISLNFNMNIGHSLFDWLLIYLPHWHAFRQNNFPVGGVISHVMDHCIDSSTFWFCEVLRAMDAFGGAAQLPPEPNNTTLYCYKSLYLIHIVMWQRMY